MPTTLTIPEFERQFGADTIRRLFTDDGGPQAAASLIMHTLERADSEAIGLLMKGGSSDWARRLLAEDIACRGYAYTLAIAMAALRRPEFLRSDGAGGTLYDTAAKDARARLKEVGEARSRSQGETVAGTNAHVAARVSPSPARKVFLGTAATRNRTRGMF